MTDTIGLIVEIKAKMTELEKALNTAEGKVKTFAKKSDNHLLSIGKGLIAGGAIYQVINVLGAAGQKIDDIAAKSENLGISATGFQQLEYAAKRTDTSFAAVSTNFNFFKKTLGNALSGNDAAIKSFNNLGLSVDKLSKMDTTQAFSTTAKAISAIENEYQQVSSAVSVFGRSASDNMNFVRADLQALNQEFNQLEIGLSEEDLASYAALDKQIDQLTTKIGGELMQAVVALAPAAEVFFTTLSKILGILPSISSGLADMALWLTHSDPDKLLARQKKSAEFGVTFDNTINQKDIDFARSQGIRVPKGLPLESQIPGLRDGSTSFALIDAGKNIKDQATAISDALKDGADVIRQGLTAYDNMFTKAFDAQKASLTNASINRIMKLVPGQKDPIIDEQFDQMVANLVGDLRKGVNPNSTGIGMQLGFIEDRAKTNAMGNFNVEGQLGTIAELKKFIQSMGGTAQKVDVNVTIADMTESFYIKWSTNQTVNQHIDKKFEDNLAQAAKAMVN